MNYEDYRGKTLTIRDLSAGAANYAADSIEDDTSRDFLYAMISIARRAGACKNYTQKAFKNYLLDIGLNKYIRAILPVEKQAAGYEPPEYPPYSGAKIIPFLGVSLDTQKQQGGIQDEIDNFLREMGYIK